MSDVTSIKSAKTSRATLKDVADLAGVSQISVSRVMRNAPNISVSLRKKVNDAANALSYTPNRVAGALKNQRANLIAVVLPSMGHDVFSPVRDGIEAALGPEGVNAVLGLSDYDPDRELKVIRELLSWSPKGIILTGLHHNETIVGMITQLDVPVIQIMDIEGLPLGSAVGFSQTLAARTAADYLFERGYRRIGYVGAWRERPDRSKARRLAFEARLEELGAPLVTSIIMEERSSAAVGSLATSELLARHPEVDSIFFANDDLALGGLFHAISAGIDVPNQLGLLGFNGIEIGKATPITLSSIETPRYEMGFKAAELLLAVGNETQQIFDLGFKVFEGGST